MIVIEISKPDNGAAAPEPGVAGHVPVACFGEPGVDHRPGCSRHRPPAAGLFGMASDAAPLLLREMAGRA